MSKKFDQLIDSALEIERELRSLSGDKPSIRGWVSACLSRGGLVYADVEAVKERLGADLLQTRMVDSGAYCRDLRRYIVAGSVREPPRADRIGAMFFSQRDGSVAELEVGRRCCLPWSRLWQKGFTKSGPSFSAVSTTSTRTAQNSKRSAPNSTGGSRARGLMTTSISGKSHLTAAALITFRLAPDEVPVHPPGTAAERLIDYLLAREQEAPGEAKAA